LVWDYTKNGKITVAIIAMTVIQITILRPADFFAMFLKN